MYAIPVYKPFLPIESITYVNEALFSGWISSAGKYIELCEEELKKQFGYKHIILTSNGTVANHLIAKCLKKFCRHKEIITPNNAYVAAWNPFFEDNYFNIEPIDCDIHTWNADYYGNFFDSKIIQVVHNLGNIVDVPYLKEKYSDCIFIEDNCEGLFGWYRGKESGTESIMSSLSFYANKNITSGEGGAFVTNNYDLYTYAKCIYGQGQSKKRYISKYLGYNYRMTNIQAAILYGQLKNLDEIIAAKEFVFDYYRDEFFNMDDNRLTVQDIDEHCTHSNWMFGIRIIGSDYRKAESFFSANGIETRPMFYPITYHKQYEYLNGICDITNAEILSKECIILPSYPELTIDQLKFIISTVKEYLFYLKED